MSIRADLQALAPTPAKILIIDIERLPGQTPIWDQKVRGGFISVHQWTRLPSLLCWAAKWHGKPRVIFESAWKDPDAMVQRSWDLFDAADIVVTYNGRAFDNKHLRAQWMLAGLGPPSPWRDVDLYVQSAQFGLESRSLRHLCERLNIVNKTGHYDLAQAEAAVEGNRAAQRDLRRYNVGDVIATEAAFDALRPWIKGINLGLYLSDGATACPACGHDQLDAAGFATTAVTRYPVYRCRACGGVSRGKHRSAAVTLRQVPT